MENASAVVTDVGSTRVVAVVSATQRQISVELSGV